MEPTCLSSTWGIPWIYQPWWRNREKNLSWAHRQKFSWSIHDNFKRNLCLIMINSWGVALGEGDVYHWPVCWWCIHSWKCPDSAWAGFNQKGAWQDDLGDRLTVKKICKLYNEAEQQAGNCLLDKRLGRKKETLWRSAQMAVLQRVLFVSVWQMD